MTYSSREWGESHRRRFTEDLPPALQGHGLVVDDAIVVLENIFTKIEDGMAPREAGVKGSSEVYFAIIATTIALAAVFLPVIFLQGITGRLFNPRRTI